MRQLPEDTIAAIATPVGYGGIAIVRASGNAARAVGAKLFRPAKATAFLPPRRMQYGTVVDTAGRVLDSVLAVFMPGPHSATGEDVLEIHCHGGPGVATAILEAMLSAGARMAGAGEFTRRGFLQGKIDLTQAEAVAEIIHASGAEGVRLASAKLSGAFGQKIRQLRQQLDALRTQIILAVDFPDDEPEVLDRQRFAHVVAQTLAEIDSLLLAFERARLWREGAQIVLAGCVNAGKSSLFNTLLGRHRALVSPLPGTTRDYIEEFIVLQGFSLRLLDTAGLRVGETRVEQEGIALSHELVAAADVVLLVVDAAKKNVQEEQAFLQQHGYHGTNRVIVVYSKADIPQEKIASDLAFNGPTFIVSAHTGAGVDALCQGVITLLQAQQAGQEVPGSDLVPNLRQSKCLQDARLALYNLQAELPLELPPDILGVPLDAALYALDSVTGTTPNESLLDDIFSSFCIGK